jgi:hypothetical protein
MQPHVSALHLELCSEARTKVDYEWRVRRKINRYPSIPIIPIANTLLWILRLS